MHYLPCVNSHYFPDKYERISSRKILREVYEKEYDRQLLDNFSDKFDKDSIILDAGCGSSGHIGKYISEKGFNVIGIDISDKCIELAQKNNPLIKFKRQDITEMQFENNLFDGIISYYSIINTPKKLVLSHL